MWELTQEVVDQRWEVLIAPLARRRRFRRGLWRVLACLFLVTVVFVTWFVALSGVADAIHLPALGLRR